MEPNFCMENGLKTMETMDSMINIGGYGIWEWGINLKQTKIGILRWQNPYFLFSMIISLP